MTRRIDLPHPPKKNIPHKFSLDYAKTYNSFFRALFATFALSINYHASCFTEVWSPIGVQTLALLICFFVLFQKADTTNGFLTRLASFVLAFCVSFASILYSQNTIQWFCGSISVAILGISTLGLFFIFNLALVALDKNLNTNRLTMSRSPNQPTIKTGVLIFFSLQLMWLPSLIIMFPGSASWDYSNEISQVLGITNWSTHHPIMMTFLFGIIWKAGFFFGQEIGALALTTIIQTAITAAIFTLSLLYLTRIIKNRICFYFIHILWGLIPIVQIYMQWEVKDTLSSALLFLFLLLCIMRLRKSQLEKKYSLIYSMPALSFIGVIASLSRNNYTFVVITALLIFLIVEKKITQKVAITIAILCVSLACTGFNALISHVDNMETGSKAEMLSFPLQATARTLVKYPDDITPEEEEILSILFGQERFSNMKNYYNPQISDPVKYEINTDQELLTSYFAIWIEQGIRHPITYLESFFLCGAGYLSPNYPSQEGTSPLQARIQPAEEYDEAISTSLESPWQSLREGYCELTKSLAKLPFVNLLFSPSFYIWICIFSLIKLKEKHQQEALIGFPLAILLLTDIFSPLNGSVRYALPFIFIVPLLIGLLWSKKE